MTDFEILVPKFGDEPPQRKRKSESPGSSSYTAPIRSFHKVECDSWDDDDYIDPAVEKEYWRQVLESDGFDVDRFALPDGGIYPYIFRDKYDYPYDIALFSRLGLHCYNLQKGTNLRLIAINKYNDEMLGRLFQYYITLEAIETSNNSLCNFQTCVCQDFTPKDSSFMVQTELSRLKVPAGPRTTFIGPQRRWNDDAVDDSYKGKLPSWLTEQELSNKGQFYELQESDWQGNEWLHMYAEFALYSKFFAYGNDLRHFLPLEMKKIIVQTQENREASPHMILKANNAIFYISFKGNGDPSGTPMEYQAIVRRTMDGMPGHICLEVDCLAYKSC
ncbi:Protein MS5 [Arabidopsis suecica]|uniref:Protein MS5 n=1 Tax=Arabidopsis suecica TaxID=45249 RepID=A0A8T1YIE2_ARASU|nr:Protein MS5 [Arabidopsis suecica]